MSTRKKAVIVVLLGFAGVFSAKPAEVSAAAMSCGTTYCGISCWDLLWTCLAQGCSNSPCLQQNCRAINGYTYPYEMSCTGDQ
jgi:hypothetical protein